MAPTVAPTVAIARAVEGIRAALLFSGTATALSFATLPIALHEGNTATLRCIPVRPFGFLWQLRFCLFHQCLFHFPQHLSLLRSHRHHRRRYILLRRLVRVGRPPIDSRVAGPPRRTTVRRWLLHAIRCEVLAQCEDAEWNEVCVLLVVEDECL